MRDVLGTYGINFVEHDEVPTVLAHRASFESPLLSETTTVLKLQPNHWNQHQPHVSAAVLAKSYRRSEWRHPLKTYGWIRSPWIEELASLNATKSPQYTLTVHPLSPSVEQNDYSRPTQTSPRSLRVVWFFSGPYLWSRYWYSITPVCLSSVTWCIVPKRCVLQQLIGSRI